MNEWAQQSGEGMPGGYGKPWRVPTGEWTVSTIDEWISLNPTTWRSVIAFEHNAALANEAVKSIESMTREREKYQRSQEKVREYFDLLAAEREQSARNVSALAKAHQQQLAVEREKVASAQELMAEVRQWHSDKDSPDYNDCDTEPCQWCESSLKLGTDCMDAHIGQKTWELKKQLAAERKENKMMRDQIGVHQQQPATKPLVDALKDIASGVPDRKQMIQVADAALAKVGK